MIVNSADELNCLVELVLCDIAGPGQDDRSSVLDLVLIEFCKILQVYLALGCVNNSNCSAYLTILDTLDSSNYIRELAYA